MSHILRMATVGIVLTFAASGVAQARPFNYQHDHFRSGYASQVYSPAGPRGGGFASSARHPDGYDGDQYWWGGDCWPTDPGACDWAQ
jgi:hypothetical protein